MPDPLIVHVDAVHCIAFWNNVAIVDIGGDIDPTSMRALGETYATLRQSCPNGIIALVMAQPNTPVGSEPARAEGARMLKALGDGLLQIIVVIEERGLLAQLLRSVMRSINVLVRNSRMSVADTVDEGVRLALDYVDSPQPTAEVELELKAAIQVVRNTFASFPQRVARLNSQRAAARR